jgi:uncharacterized protein (TIGR02246 family)
MSSSDSDEKSIHALYFQMMDGWNNGSGEAFAAPFEEDGEQIAFDGTHFRGRQDIASFHQQLFDTFVKGSRLVGKVRSVRFLTPDVAIMHTIGGTIMADQTDIEPERNSVQVFTVKKDDKGNWHIAAFANIRAQYMGRPAQFQELTEELRSLI